MRITPFPPRFAAALLALLLTVGAGPGASAAERSAFADVPSGAWYAANVSWAIERGIVSGYGDGTFRPDAKPTEAEFLAMLLRAKEEAAVRKAAPAEAWYAPYYEKAAEAAYPVALSRAEAPITRGNAARIIAASFGHRLGRVDAVKFVLEANISNGRTAPTVEGYDIDGQMTRAEAVAFVRRVESHRELLAAKEEQTVEEKEPQTPPPIVVVGNGGNPGNGGNGQRPDAPVRTTDDEEARESRLDAALSSLGVAMSETGQGLVVAHPNRTGGGAVLTRSDERVGSIHVLDDGNAVVTASAHALLAYAGASVDRDVFLDTLKRVRESGNNAALKIGGQLITVVRDANPGQLIVHFTLFES